MRPIGLLIMATLLARGGAVRAQGPSTADELRRWAELFWYLQDHGQPHQDAAAFRFTDESLNARGVLPLSANFITHASIYESKLASLGACAADDPVSAMISVPEMAASVRAYSLDKELSTPLSDPAAALKHLQAAVFSTVALEQFTDPSQFLIMVDGIKTKDLKIVQGYENLPLLDPIAPGNGSLEGVAAGLEAIAQTIAAQGLDTQVDPLGMLTGAPGAGGSAYAVSRMAGALGYGVTLTPTLIVWGDHSSRLLTRVDWDAYTFVIDGVAGHSYGPMKVVSGSPAAEGLRQQGLIEGGTATMVVATGAGSACQPLMSWITPDPPGVWVPGLLPLPPGQPWVPVTPTPGGGWSWWTCHSTPGGWSCFRRRNMERLWCVPFLGFPCRWQDGDEDQTCVGTGTAYGDGSIPFVPPCDDPTTTHHINPPRF